jgi:hypothetical protein
MKSRSSLQIGLAVVAVVALMTLAVRLQRERDDRYPLPETTEETLYLTSGGALQRLSLGYRSLAADVYWIRAIQHFGGRRQRIFTPSQPGGVPQAEGSEPYRLLYPLLDLTTTLDPYFKAAYRFGSIFLAEPYPGGPGRPDLAIALLEKGLAVEPDNWEYMQDIGFVHYWWDHDYQAAGAWFAKAADAPDAPWWMRSMAAVTLASGGNRQSSRQMWQSIAQSATVEYQRNHAQRALVQLDALDQIDVLRPIVDRFVRETGMPARDWQTLVRAGALRGIPVDPTGVPYRIQPDGSIDVDPTSPLYPLPKEPQRTGAQP